MKLKPEDLSISAWASKSVNGFCNTVSRGIKIVHLPTGLTATCDSERSQHRNKAVALAELQSKLAELAAEFAVLASAEPIKQVTEPPLDARNMAAGTHCWALLDDKLVVVIKSDLWKGVTECYFYVCGGWEGSVSERELTLLEVIARPLNYSDKEIYYG